MSATNALVPFRSNPIGGRPALYTQNSLRNSENSQYNSPTRSLRENSPDYFKSPSNSNCNWLQNPQQSAPYSYQNYQLSNIEEIHTVNNQSVPFFQPKTTTYIRKLHPSEVYDGNTDFEDGGVIFDTGNGEFPQITAGRSQSKALVPVKAANAIRSKSFSNNSPLAKSEIRVLQPDQINEEFHFTAEDFENGQTTYFPITGLMNELNIGIFPDQSKGQQFKIDNNTGSCTNPNCQNCVKRRNFTKQTSKNKLFQEPVIDMENMSYVHNQPQNSLQENDNNSDLDNRTTYGYAEFQAARQRFEQICNSGGLKMPNNQIVKKDSYAYQNPPGEIIQSQFCRGSSNFCGYGPTSKHEPTPMKKAMSIDNGFQGMNSLQQYVVAEESGPGGVKKIFSFPAGETPGDLTLLRAAVAANQPQDPFIPEDYEDGEVVNEINLMDGSVQQSFSFQNNKMPHQSHQGRNFVQTHTQPIDMSQKSMIMSNNIVQTPTNNTTVNRKMFFSQNNLLPMQDNGQLNQTHFAGMQPFVMFDNNRSNGLMQNPGNTQNDNMNKRRLFVDDTMFVAAQHQPPMRGPMTGPMNFPNNNIGSNMYMLRNGPTINTNFQQSQQNPHFCGYHNYANSMQPNMSFASKSGLL